MPETVTLSCTRRTLFPGVPELGIASREDSREKRFQPHHHLNSAFMMGDRYMGRGLWECKKLKNHIPSIRGLYT